jgi:cytochrome c peroxidase
MIALIALIALPFMGGCKEGSDGLGPMEMVALASAALSPGSSGYQWNLPTGFPTPRVPAGNAMSTSKVELGRHLFYDKRLSRDGSKSCASCHDQSRAFTDGRSLAVGLDLNVNGVADPNEIHTRNAQHLVNAAYNARYTWANSTVTLLENQAEGPLFGTGAPIVEMGLTTPTDQSDAVNRIALDSIYPPMFRRAFGSDTVDLDRIKKAIASFERTLISGDSTFDRYYYTGNTTGMSASARSGMLIFFGETAECFHCHSSFNFSDTVLHNATVYPEVFFHSNGIYDDAQYGAAVDQGLRNVSGLAADTGRFRAPSLRNVAKTYPYMHDGSIRCAAFVEGAAWNQACAEESLLKVIDHYSVGGRCYDAMGNLNGACTTIDTTLVRPFALTAQQKADLVQFLMTLTDDGFLSKPAFANPRVGDANFGM